MKKNLLLIILFSNFAIAQIFTKQDTLKGSDTRFRNFWDVKKYEIAVEPDFENQSVSGSNKIIFEITKDVENPIFQIDLQQPMKVEKMTSNFARIDDFRRDGDFVFIDSRNTFKKGQEYFIEIQFSGNPKIAKHSPWDGGWVFSKDESGNPWISVAQEGNGASLWLPIKEIWSDEPDNGIVMKIITPKDLVGVGNGRLISEASENDKKNWTWEVKNSINAYSIVPTIGKLVNFKDSYNGEKGKLDLDYWVLQENLEKAKKQFQQVKPMMKAFEYWFGPYPFYEDSYKLVETPYLGMEHQSNVAYGNHYQNGYAGRDLSDTGVGLNWDFIIVHESGHEWFANNITAKDQADMWIHESFTCYSETLFTEKYMDKKSAEIYIKGLRKNIENKSQIIGKYGVRNEAEGTDMYYKGANMIHTIRQIIGNDEKFRQILRGMNRDFYHQTVITKQIEDYISKKSGIDLSSIFNQYLRTTKIPTLEYYIKSDKFYYRWKDVVEKFHLPIKIKNLKTIIPSEKWQNISIYKKSTPNLDDSYYVNYSEVQ